MDNIFPAILYFSLVIILIWSEAKGKISLGEFYNAMLLATIAGMLAVKQEKGRDEQRRHSKEAG